MRDPNLTLNEQEGAWIHEVAGRLRLVQADSATAAPAQRREFLSEELGRAFRQVASADRKRYLRALLARFPVGGRALETAAAVPAAPAAEAAAPETFEQQLERLIQAAAGLDENRRAQAAKRLSEVGLAGGTRPGPAVGISEEVQKALGLSAGQEAGQEALARLCALLVEAFQRLDQTSIATLRELAPRNPLLKRPQEFRAAAAAFLTGQGDEVEPHIRLVSSVLGALLAAMLGGARDFGYHFVERLSPSAIEDVVIGEGGGSSLFGKSKKERCWERYILLCKEFETADLVERRLRDCLAAFVEKKILSGR